MRLTIERNEGRSPIRGPIYDRDVVVTSIHIPGSDGVHETPLGAIEVKALATDQGRVSRVQLRGEILRGVPDKTIRRRSDTKVVDLNKGGGGGATLSRREVLWVSHKELTPDPLEVLGDSLRSDPWSY